MSGNENSLVKTWHEVAVKVRAQDASWWAAAFFVSSLCVVALVCIGCCLYIKAHASKPLSRVVWESCTSLVWAFVLELIFDALVAHRARDKVRDLEEMWFLGFFHRWKQERDEYIKRFSD
mmetsp:Transcript_79891/g.225938  ORF Transcript_79891/g.225938 Transcript_79891/m.225938 type:complete len:120 (+) Transcript_79891:35-394(+)